VKGNSEGVKRGKETMCKARRMIKKEKAKEQKMDE
jgi:hypothetical protein